MILGRGITDKVFLHIMYPVILVTLILLSVDVDNLAVHYYRTQDLPVILAMCATLGLAVFWLPGAKLPDDGPRPFWVVAAAFALAMGLWAGTYWLMYDYPLTRDEHMVAFDMAIFASGHSAAPLPASWAGYAEALVPAFLLDIPRNELLVSAYMPVNALARAAFSTLADPALMNPLLFAIGLLALFDISKRLLADKPNAIWVVLAAYILSSQALVTAMTNYAMTAHLALNLVWLALFLRGKWWQHVLAMAIGIAAIGLHQIVFHPLFAGPILLSLLPQRRWRLFGAYSVVYAAALLLWISYPSMLASGYGIVAENGSTGGIADFISERVLTLFADSGGGGIWYMMLNLLRFVAWAPLFLLPLLLFAWPAIRSNRDLALPLLGGVAATLFAMMILLPNQGHGWGYRYWHGLQGNFALLAGYGYTVWAERDRKRADGAVIFLGAMTAILFIPFLLWAAHNFTRPYVQLTRLIERQATDFVLVDTQPPSNAVDQVRNLPSLMNRPILLSSRAMTASQVGEICSRGSVTLITRRDFHRAGFVLELPDYSPKFEKLVKAIRTKDCVRPAR